MPDAATRHFMELVSTRAFADATEVFDDKMKAGLSVAELEAMWTQLDGSLGGFKELGKVRTEASKPYRVFVIPCVFAKGTLEAKLAWDDHGRLAGLYFTQPAGEYTPPGYAAKDAVTREVVVGQDPWKLPGELVLPAGAGPFPAIVLVHGSGPGDRNESVGPNRPFQDIAFGLAAKGIAVLRYDKRTRVHGKSLGSVVATFTVKEETIDDALAAVALLRATPEIDPARVFVLGHSLGGQLAPRIVEADPKLAGYVILAGSTGGIGDAIVRQTEYIFRLDGDLTADEEAKLSPLRAHAERVRAIAGGAEASPTEMIFGAAPAYWRDLGKYDAPALAAKIDRPVFVLQGDRDYQVTRTDFDAWKKALGSKPRATLTRYAKLNHLMMVGDGPSGPEEYKLPSHVDGQVIDDMATWIASIKK